jgi:hypothetical protein
MPKQPLKPIPDEIVELLRQGLYIINPDGVITPRPNPHADATDWEYDEWGNEVPAKSSNPNKI